jgi:hypothetical protein
MKKLQRGCSWRCTALILVAVCVILLACTLYFSGQCQVQSSNVKLVSVKFKV